jgi:site-specific recombinase XerD
MLIQDAIVEFLRQRQTKNVAESTRDYYERQLRYWRAWRVAQELPEDLHGVQVSDFLDYLHYLKHERIAYCDNDYRNDGAPGLSANSVANAHRVLRTFWHWCDAAGLLLPEQCTFFARGCIPAPYVPEEPRPTYDDGVFARMVDAARNPDPEICYRDQAILWLFKDTGLRISELCNLTDEAIDQEKRRAKVLGKGRKHGFVFWHDDTAYALARYLQFRTGTPGGWLFRGAGTRNTGGQMTPVAVRRMFRRLAQRAGVELPKGAPVHALRHTFAHDALDAGLDLSQVSQLMRHSDIATTMRYLRENPDELQEVYNRIKKSTS